MPNLKEPRLKPKRNPYLRARAVRRILYAVNKAIYLLMAWRLDEAADVLERAADDARAEGVKVEA